MHKHCRWRNRSNQCRTQNSWTTDLFQRYKTIIRWASCNRTKQYRRRYSRIVNLFNKAQTLASSIIHWSVLVTGRIRATVSSSRGSFLGSRTLPDKWILSICRNWPGRSKQRKRSTFIIWSHRPSWTSEKIPHTWALKTHTTDSNWAGPWGK